MRSMIILTILAGCGSGDPGGGGPDSGVGPDPATRYEPWKVGSVWSYKLTDPTNTLPARLNARTTVEAEEDIGGTHAGKLGFRLRVEQLDGHMIAYQGFEGYLAVRYAQTDYDLTGAMVDVQDITPYRLKLDESVAHLAANATYSESFTIKTTNSAGTMSNAKTENWQVIAVAEPVTVMAGTYTALHVRRSNPGGATAKTKDYWFVQGVGKVKETGGGQDEELMSYTP